MSHYRNRRSFAARTARGFMRLHKFSSPGKPAPAGLASAWTTGSGEGSDSKAGACAGLGTRDRDDGHKGNSGQGVVPTAPPCGVTTDTANAFGGAYVNESQNATLAALASQPGVVETQQRGSHEVTSKPYQQRPTPLPTNSAGGGVLVAVPFLVLAAFDRYATLAVIIATLVIFAWAVVRANMK